MSTISTRIQNYRINRVSAIISASNRQYLTNVYMAARVVASRTK